MYSSGPDPKFSAARPLVALADPHWMGHRETYFREFTLSLDRAGADVVALCPDPVRLSSLREAAAQSNGNGNGNSPPLPLHSGVLTEPARLPVLQWWPQDPITTHLRWRRLSKALQGAEAKLGRKVDLVFLPWLDCYLRASVHLRLMSHRFSTPWAGLYFRPHHLIEAGKLGSAAKALFQGAAKGDALLRSAECKAVATLDETLCPVLETTSGKPAIVFPDITDETPPDGQSDLAREVRSGAAGRKVVGLIGMEPRKGVVTMLKTAEVARRQGKPWLFVLAGHYEPGVYSESERRFIARHIADSYKGDPEGNVFFPKELRPIPDGRPFNDVMNEFDVLFVAYHDFLGSSNVLTKAALLKKPVVCTDLGCIAHRCREYDLGLAIPQGDAAQCCEAIERLLLGVNWDGDKLRPRHADYHAQHDRARLDQSMRELLALLPGARQPMAARTLPALA